MAAAQIQAVGTVCINSSQNWVNRLLLSLFTKHNSKERRRKNYKTIINKTLRVNTGTSASTHSIMTRVVDTTQLQKQLQELQVLSLGTLNIHLNMTRGKLLCPHI